jgi:hypothetical protein
MKFRIKNEGGEEFEFEGDEKEFSVVVGQLDGRLFDPVRPRDRDHRWPTTGPSPTSGQPRSGETMTTNAIAAARPVHAGRARLDSDAVGDPTSSWLRQQG